MIVALFTSFIREEPPPLFRFTFEKEEIQFKARGIFKATAYLENISDHTLNFVNLTSDFKKPSFLWVAVVRMHECQPAHFLTQTKVTSEEQLFVTSLPPKTRVKLNLEFEWKQEAFIKFFDSYAEPGRYALLLEYDLKMTQRLMSQFPKDSRNMQRERVIQSLALNPAYGRQYARGGTWVQIR